MLTSQGLINVRYPSRCITCGHDLRPGTPARWDRSSRTATCANCALRTNRAPSAPTVTGVAGGSALARGERERARNERRRAEEIARRRDDDDSIRQRHRYLGRLAVAVRGLTDPPPSPEVAAGSWEKGAKAEEGFGQRLAALAAAGYPVLHDRRKPGTPYNLDHVVVAPDGVWVIDMKSYSGRLEHRGTGTILRPASDLYVGGRRRTQLVDKMGWQVDTVQRAVGELLDGHGGRVQPVLCFTGVTMPIDQRPFTIGGVLVTWPAAAVSAIEHCRGPLSYEIGLEIAARLAAAPPPGS